jgi:hypothetical protein
LNGEPFDIKAVEETLAEKEYLLAEVKNEINKLKQTIVAFKKFTNKVNP